MTQTTTADTSFTEPGADPAATVAAMKRWARERQAFAVQNRAQAAERMAELEERHRAERAEAEADARSRGTSADQAEREAHGVAERARWADSAIAKAAEAASEDADVARREAKRSELLERIASFGERLATLRANKDQAEAEVADAQETDDADLIAAAEMRLSGFESAITKREGEQANAQRDLAEIGDGTGRGTLLEARNRASAAHADAERMFRDAFPDSAAAIAWRQREDWRLIGEAQRERLAEEQRAAQQPRRQSVVRQ